jgi:acetolactate synthase small subunit
MPERTIGKIMSATDPADVAQMAVIECLRQIADNGKTANRQLEAMQVEIRDVRERIIRIEATEFKGEIARVEDRTEALAVRLDALESKEDRRAGAMGLAQWGFQNWPGVLIAIITIITVLVANGKVSL